MNKAHFWLADRSGCGYYRGLLPFSELKTNGYAVAANEALNEQNFNGILVGQRVCKLGPSIIWQRLKNRGDCNLVYELDDDLFSIDRSNEAAYYMFTHPETVDNLEHNLSTADLVTVTNEPLAEVVRKYNDNVSVLPNYIDSRAIYIPRLVPTIKDDKNQNVDMNQYVLIGYVSSPTHAMDFATVAEQLILLGERDKRVVYVWYGERYELPVQQIAQPWVPIGPDYYKRFNFDIGIAPLAKHKFNESKSHIKALEYAAAGIPVVASDELPYRDFVQHGKTGFLAPNPGKFYVYLRELVNNETLRKEMGYNAREYAKNFTMQEHYTKWAETYGLVKP